MVIRNSYKFVLWYHPKHSSGFLIFDPVHRADTGVLYSRWIDEFPHQPKTSCNSGEQDRCIFPNKPGQMEWLSGQHSPQSANVPLMPRSLGAKWKGREEKSTWLQVERGAFSHRAALVVDFKLPHLRLADELRASLRMWRGAWSAAICSRPRRTLGWLECARARWMMPRTSQAKRLLADIELLLLASCSLHLPG